MNSSETQTHRSGLEVAIIGLAARFPGAANVEQFWQNLREGVESITFFTDQELEAAGVAPRMLRDPNYVKARGTLADIDLFDAAFFGINPKEAEIMDPQHRLFLESAWEALENAGYDSERYRGAIGVYAGVGLNSYLFNIYSNPQAVEALGFMQTGIGNDKDHVATRVSYKLNLRGPSLTIQTACSTSLVAVHQACQALLFGSCDMALAGGASIGLPQTVGYLYREGSIMSPDGHTRTFDARAQGCVSSSGVGVVVLKRLEDALADGDSIQAIIKGSAINNDGSMKVGYTAPSVSGQAEVIKAAQTMAEVEPETISYIEAHGTATALGDPIEIAALTQAFREKSTRKGFCAIGSVKSNFGHLDTAAGVAGLIKTVLALKHQAIPASLHFEQPNPKIDFDDSPFYVNTSLRPWPAAPAPRRAGVSSFGIGGTNAHVILEEGPAAIASSPPKPWQLILLSAKTDAALEAQTANLANHLQRRKDLNLGDVSYTLQVGRRHFSRRRFVVSRDLDDTLSALASPDRMLGTVLTSGNRATVFMFPGQGAQHVHMGAGLYAHEPVFRETIDGCSEMLEPRLGVDLRRLIYPPTQATQAAEQLQQTRFAQPALFIVEYALARLWMSWGLNPQAMIGHSIGEIIAACLAGVFSLEEALMLVAARGGLMQQLPEGAMLSVALSEKEVAPFVGQQVNLAAVNGPSRCVLSGGKESIAEVEIQLKQQGIPCRQLHTSHAFHSEMMSPILEAFTDLVRGIDLQPPQIPFISNVTGTWISAAQATDPAYWASHLRQTVQFASGMEALYSKRHLVLLEVGPGDTLAKLARMQKSKTSDQVVLGSLPPPDNRVADLQFLLTTVGQLWLQGIEIDWPACHTAERRQRLPLPTYAFERKRYWIDRRKNSAQPRRQDDHQGAPQESLPIVAEALNVTEAEDAVFEQLIVRQLQLMNEQLDLLCP